jgi:hypothetical protein
MDILWLLICGGFFFGSWGMVAVLNYLRSEE